MPMLESKQIMKYLFLAILIFINSGCSLLKGKTKSAGPPLSASPLTLQQEKFLQSAKILDEDQFKKGGRILVVPFTPDVNAAADDELDRVSLMIVKGIADSLDTSSRFRVLDSGNADTADLILHGRVMTMQETGRLKKLATFKNKKYIAVEGKMVDVKSGRIVFLFSDAKTTQNKKQTFIDLGSFIGHDIGKFLNSSQTD